MSDVIEQEPEVTSLTVVERASVALAAPKHEQELRALVQKSVDIVEIKNKDAREQCHSALMALRTARTNIKSIGEAARADATAFQKAVIAEAARLTAITEAEETRLQTLRDAWDEKVRAEKAETARIEAERQTKIQALIDDIKFAPVRAAGKTAEEIAALKDAISETVIDAGAYGQRAGDAMMARSNVVAALTEMFDLAVATERGAAEAARQAEAARIERERVEEANRVESERLAALAADMARKEQEARTKRETGRAEQFARDQAERRRHNAIREHIEFLGDFVRAAVGMSSAKVTAIIETLEAEEITADAYAEFIGEAETVKAASLAKMREMLSAQQSQEAHAAQMKADRAEIERQQAELQRQQEAADNVARINRETQERLEQEQKLEADHAEALTENARIDADRAEQQRQQAEADARYQRELEQAEEQARRDRVNFTENGPGDLEIVVTLAEQFAVDIDDVVRWIAKFDHSAIAEKIKEAA